MELIAARWWDNAKAEDIVRVHQTATALKGQDPMTCFAADTHREYVQHRYGIGVHAMGTGIQPGCDLCPRYCAFAFRRAIVSG
ncbi:hypothetical protein ACIP9X_14495 [Arthrobacter sp. NPDC093125]|uniref:hypothetical protein n=1 Tax=Arthrobacter sp. NPDC093125 TaxID=3363944 RepID=UPI003815A31E